MLLGLGAAALALRAGLRIRTARRRGGRRPPGLLRRHLRLAKPAVVALLIGFAAGPVSSLLLRDWAPFEHFHGWLGLAAAALFGATGILGWRLERGRSRARDLHGLLGVLALLASAVAAVAGFALLP